MNLRARAARLLVQVVDEGRSLSRLLPAALKDVPDRRERALIQELVFGTLRWYHQLAALLPDLMKKPLKQKDSDLHKLLLVGLYQLAHLSIAPHAAVHETVQATRELDKAWATGLVNAVLRTFQRESGPRLSALSTPGAVYSHPDWLVQRIQADWPDHWEAILAANNERPPFSLRVNQQQVARDSYLGELGAASIDATKLEYAPEGVLVAGAVATEKLPGFDEGRVSVQDGAAQLVAGALELAPGQRVLDACAAPGGKTAHILETEPALDSLVAVDSDKRRLARVTENLERLGLQAQLVCADAGEPGDWWDGQSFDRVLLDVPCSAIGVIRRHPDIKLLRRADDIRALAGRQQALLRGVWPLVKSGGMLLYTTCSVLAEENEMQIKSFLEANADAVVSTIDAKWGQAREFGRQILPGTKGMDGFYYARLIKH